MRRTRRTFPMACRFPTNWRGARSVCARSPKHARRSRCAPRNATRARWRSMKPNSRRARPRLRPRAKSPAASRRRLQLRDRCRAIRSISPTKTRASCRWREAASSNATMRKPPQPPAEGPLPSDQINLTDKDSRSIRLAGGAVNKASKAQAAVAAGTLLVVAIDVVLAPNDKQQLEPMLGKIGALPEELGEPETLLADTGNFRAANVEACAAAGIEPLIAMGRQPHHPPLTDRFETAPPAPKNPTPVEAMAHRLRTPEGKDLYALRKQTPEPVFGIIKAALGFRQFSLRGLDKVRGEWSLVTMAWNMKRMFALSPA